MALRWGICATGRIANDFVCGLSTLDPSLHSVSAVAGRSAEKSQKFAQLHQISKSYASYEELATDDDIDIVYIGAINSAHAPLCKLYLNHNKNVLCEKPLGLNVTQATEILSLAKEKNLFFMEAVWSRFFPVYEKTREILANNEIGEVQLVQGTFGLSIMTKVHIAKKGVDEGANITLMYPGNKMATLVYSGICSMTNNAEIFGTEGKIKICGPFWCPTHMEVTNNATKRTDTLHFPIPKSKVKSFYPNGTGLRYEAEAVRRAINNGKKEHPVMNHRASVSLATIVEKVRNSLGYVIEGDGANACS